jgi:site-specific DNA-methyltransferase (adenine-specific)/modification methylase
MIVREERIGGQRLILGDCLAVMPTLGRFDAVVTDPPYGIGEGNAKVRSRQRTAKSRALADQRQYVGDGEWDATPASAEHIAMMRAISRNQIIFGGNYFEGLGPTSCWLVWDKQNGENDFADCELAWTNLPKAVRRVYWRWHGMIRKGDDVREHPTQKPLGVIEWCIGNLPPSAATIFDPFMGSGTTLVACQRLGRNGTGIEIDPEYFDIACRRVDEATRQPDLFVEMPAKPSAQEPLL